MDNIKSGTDMDAQRDILKMDLQMPTTTRAEVAEIIGLDGLGRRFRVLIMHLALNMEKWFSQQNNSDIIVIWVLEGRNWCTR